MVKYEYTNSNISLIHFFKNMTQFHSVLKSKMDNYVHFVYFITRNFPKEELCGVTSQLRRSSLSVILNYIEGYARQKCKVNKNFLEISYASLKESSYLLDFSFKEKYLSAENYHKTKSMADEIGAMLWSVIINK